MSRRARFLKTLAGAWLAAAAATVTGQARAQQGAAVVGATAPVQMLSGERLQAMSPAQLDALYRAAAPGPKPKGRVKGVPIVSPGKAMGPALSKAARVVWQGKVFREDGSSAVNRFFGVRAIQGNVLYGPSWLDGRPSLLLDYQGTSLVYGRYRDEIRQVGPGLYLGVMYARTSSGPVFTRYFAFETHS